MAGLWADGFDTYGSSVSLMLNGAYAAAAFCTLSTANPRTGAYALRITAGNDAGPRRVFGGDKTQVGIGHGFYLPTLPTNSDSVCLAQFRDNNNVAVVSLIVSSTGQIIAKRGTMNGGTVLGSSDPVVVAGSYQHFECDVIISGVAGAVVVRMNGSSTPVLNLTGVNTSTGEGVAAQVHIGAPSTAVTGFPDYLDIDDLFARDASGAAPTTFIGDRRARTVFPNADTGTSQWSISTGGTAYGVLSQNPPQDGTYYLDAAAAANQTIVDMTNLPEQVVSIAFVYMQTRTWKTDAGAASVQAAIVNGVSTQNGADRFVSQSPTYYGDVSGVDPATSTAWTRSGLNTAQLSLTRTS